MSLLQVYIVGIEVNESARNWQLNFENPRKGDYHERRTHFQQLAQVSSDR